MYQLSLPLLLSPSLSPSLSQVLFSPDDLYLEGRTSGDLPIDDEDGDDGGSGSGSGDGGNKLFFSLTLLSAAQS